MEKLPGFIKKHTIKTIVYFELVVKVHFQIFTIHILAFT